MIVEVFRNGSQVVLRELVDVTLEARLRSAALIVPPRLFLGEIGQRLEPSARQPEEQAALAVDHGDDRALAAAQQRHQRLEVEVGPDVNAVRHAVAQRARAPERVEPGGEDGEALDARAVEVVREVAADALEVGLNPALLVVGEVAPAAEGRLVRLVQKRVDLRRRARRRARHLGLEAEEEADRQAILSPESGQLPEPVPCDRTRHSVPPCHERGILFL